MKLQLIRYNRWNYNWVRYNRWNYNWVCYNRWNYIVWSNNIITNKTHHHPEHGCQNGMSKWNVKIMVQSYVWNKWFLYLDENFCNHSNLIWNDLNQERESAG